MSRCEINGRVREMLRAIDGGTVLDHYRSPRSHIKIRVQARPLDRNTRGVL